MTTYKPSGILAAPKEEIELTVKDDIDSLAPICEAAIAKADVHSAIDWPQMCSDLETVAAFFKTDRWSKSFDLSQERLKKATKELKGVPDLLHTIGLLPEQFAIDAWNCSNVLSLSLVSHGHKTTIKYIIQEWSEAMDEQVRLYNEIKKAAQVAIALNQ
jgi:hypothetical protein